MHNYGHHQKKKKMLDPVAIPKFGVSCARSDELSPAKNVLLGGTVPKDKDPLARY